MGPALLHVPSWLCTSLMWNKLAISQIPCCLDSQFTGMVEAWASGLTWKEIMMDCAMDEGDLARLLRRTIDLLAQVRMLLETSHLLLALFKGTILH